MALVFLSETGVRFVRFVRLKIEVFCERHIFLASAAVGCIQANHLLIALFALSFGKHHQGATGRLLDCCADLATFLKMQTLGKAQRYEVCGKLAGNDDRERTFFLQKRSNLWNEFCKRHTLVVAGHCATFILGQSVFCKERRVAENGIKTFRRTKQHYILQLTLNSLIEWTFGNVFPSLLNSIFVNIDTKNFGLRIPLCSHQRNKPCACANIQNALPFDAAPSPKQNAVRTHFHGASVVTDDKAFESEKVILHFP